VEAIAAQTGFLTQRRVKIFEAKKNLRLVEVKNGKFFAGAEIYFGRGAARPGCGCASYNNRQPILKVVTKNAPPTESEIRGMLFCLEKSAKHVKVRMPLSISREGADPWAWGAGQMSRVDSCQKSGAMKAVSCR